MIIDRDCNHIIFLALLVREGRVTSCAIFSKNNGGGHWNVPHSYLILITKVEEVGENCVQCCDHFSTILNDLKTQMNGFGSCLVPINGTYEGLFSLLDFVVLDSSVNPNFFVKDFILDPFFSFRWVKSPFLKLRGFHE